MDNVWYAVLYNVKSYVPAKNRSALLRKLFHYLQIKVEIPRDFKQLYRPQRLS